MREPAWAAIKVPGIYSELGVGNTKDNLQKSYKRIFCASGRWPWDWLPHDYVPQPQHWSARAAASVAIAVEAACEPGSGVSMDDLRDFLVNQAIRYRAGNPTRTHRVIKDCHSAREWIESKSFGSSVMPNEPEEVPNDTDDQSGRTTEYERENSSSDSSDEEAQSDLATENERENEWPVPRTAGASSTSASNGADRWPIYQRATSPASELSDPGSVSLSTHEQREPSLPLRGTTVHSRSRSLNDTTATRNQFGVVNFAGFGRYRSKLIKPTTLRPIQGGSDTPRTESNCLPTIDRDIRATDSRIDAAEKQVQRCIADIDKENSLVDSMSTDEPNQVIEMATQERDKAQMELDKAQFLATAVAEKVSGYERFADTITATYIEAQIKKDKAQKGLEDIKAETQRLEYQRDQAIVNIGRLQDHLEEQKMVVSNEVKKRIGLVAMRNIIIGLRSEQISTLALSHFEDLEKYTRDFMDETREPRSISQARDI